MSGEAPIEVTFRGENSQSVRAIAETLQAVDDLFRSVSKEATGQEIGLTIASVGWRCDGCGLHMDGVAIPADWVKRGGDDLCPACAGTRGPA